MMRVIGLMVMLIGTLLAEPVVVKLWTEDAEKEFKGKARPARGDGVVRVSDVEVPTMTVFRAPGDGVKPAVAVFPGGGYAILAWNKEGTEVAEWLNGIGISAFVVKYRVPKRRDDAFEDGRQALKLVRERAAEWGIDPQRVGVLGFSAGGHLSARLSTNGPAAERPAFSVLIYPAYLGDKKSGEVAKELPVSAEVPPTFIVQTNDDRGFVAGTQIYHDALKSAGVNSVFHLYETGGHGYGLRPSGHEVSKWPSLCETWMKELKVIAN